jgi:hypothetical protein
VDDVAVQIDEVDGAILLEAWREERESGTCVLGIARAEACAAALERVLLDGGVRCHAGLE